MCFDISDCSKQLMYTNYVVFVMACECVSLESSAFILLSVRNDVSKLIA